MIYGGYTRVILHVLSLQCIRALPRRYVRKFHTVIYRITKKLRNKIVNIFLLPKPTELHKPMHNFRLPPRSRWELRSRVTTLRVLAILYRRFGTTYRYHFQGSRNPRRNLVPSVKMGTVGCPETSVRNNHYELRSNSEASICHLHT